MTARRRCRVMPAWGNRLSTSRSSARQIPLRHLAGQACNPMRTTHCCQSKSSNGSLRRFRSSHQPQIGGDVATTTRQRGADLPPCLPGSFVTPPAHSGWGTTRRENTGLLWSPGAKRRQSFPGAERGGKGFPGAAYGNAHPRDLRLVPSPAQSGPGQAERQGVGALPVDFRTTRRGVRTCLRSAGTPSYVSSIARRAATSVNSAIG